ncbi:hypothetical protein BGZ46_008721 [Entomortierella lignicola]|nr:hypothetical protein BGZ46_008721 [Entomortierella lignicola]
MALSHQVFAILIVLLQLSRTIYASFAFCVGLEGPSFFGREVVAFQLWNDKGQVAAQYRTVLWARQTTMQNNGWNLYMKFENNNGLVLNNLSISSDLYGDIGPTLLAGAISLALAAGTTDESLDEIIWKDKSLQDWDNGWDVDINDNPVNINAACFGMPCTRFRLVKHKNVEICVTPSGRRYVCSSNYEKTTFVYPPGPDEFDEYGYYEKDEVIRPPDDVSGLICD